jgi:hypothetical protein
VAAVRVVPVQPQDVAVLEAPVVPVLLARLPQVRLAALRVGAALVDLEVRRVRLAPVVVRVVAVPAAPGGLAARPLRSS